jgi:tRNA/tmRNA/rRNA uracil-C5-methylase (TrmA/RlmC/RlmD family)
MRVVCTANLFGGTALGQAKCGSKVLVEGALAGETVDVNVYGKKGPLLLAAVTSVLEPSPWRKVGRATNSESYGFVEYKHQLELKVAIVRNALKRGKVAFDGPVEIVPSEYVGHRMRARLHGSESGRLGFFAPRTHLTSFDGLEMLGAETREFLNRLPKLSGEVTLLENVQGNQRVLWSRDELDEGTIFESGACVFHGARPMHYCGPNTNARVDDGDGTLLRSVFGFFQGNRFLLQPLVNKVVGHVGDSRESVVDLYSGCGLFAAALAEKHDVIAVEQFSPDLKENADRFKFEAKIGSSEDFLDAGRRAANASVVVMDPARPGLSKQAMAGLRNCTKADRIVYVSCDVATFMRDAKRMEETMEYKLTKLDAFDMFPTSAHIELAGLFER